MERLRCHCLIGRLASVDCSFARDDGPRGDGAVGAAADAAAEVEMESGEENLGEDSELRDEVRITPPAAAAAAEVRSSAREDGPRGRSSRLSMAASSASSCCMNADE